MKLFIITVRDRAADVYGQPSYHTSVGAAIRSFADEINRPDPNNMLNKHPGNFDLYQLGVYDDNSGEFECGKPKQIAVGKDLVIRKDLHPSK